MLVSGDLDDALPQMNKETRDGFRLAGRVMVFHAMGDISSAVTELEKLIAIGDTWTTRLRRCMPISATWMNRSGGCIVQSTGVMDRYL